MTRKLMLTMNPDVIEKAKKYALASGTTLSDLAENYFKKLTADYPRSGEEELTPLVKSLMGSIKAPKDLDYKKIYREEKIKKYG